MAKTGPDIPGQSWKEAGGTCSECGLTFKIGKMVQDRTNETVTDPCPKEICDGSATVTLVGDK